MKQQNTQSEARSSCTGEGLEDFVWGHVQRFIMITRVYSCIRKLGERGNVVIFQQAGQLPKRSLWDHYKVNGYDITGQIQ